MTTKTQQELDLRFSHSLPQQLNENLQTIAKNITSDIDTCMDELAKANGTVPWLFTVSACRDPFTSTIFHSVATTILAKNLLNSGTLFSKIIANSKAHSELIRKQAHSSTKIFVQNHNFFYKILRPILVSLYTLLRSLYVLAITKFHKSNNIKNKTDTSTEILIDTFLLPNQTHSERYFPGIIESIPEDYRKKVRFVPLLYGITLKNCVSYIKSIRHSPLPLLLREDYLTFGDIFSAWLLTLKGQFSSIPAANCMGMDISPLIREELLSFREFGSSFNGHLVRIGHIRMRKCGIQPRLLIDWHENQPVDRGWNLGARQAFPDALRIGYQAFPISEIQHNLLPLPYEYNSGITPDVITPLGLFADIIRNTCPDITIESAPSFRFAHLFTPDDADHEKDIDIFSSLPLCPSGALDLISELRSLARQHPELTVAIRPHPASCKSIFEAVLNAQELLVADGSLSNTLTRSKILVGSASSTCLEALLKGVYVIIVATRGLLMNPIPPTVPDDMYHVSFSYEDVAHHVRHVLSMPPRPHDPRTRALLHACMTPVTAETVRSFLRLPPPHPQASDL